MSVLQYNNIEVAYEIHVAQNGITWRMPVIIISVDLTYQISQKTNSIQ